MVTLDQWDAMAQAAAEGVPSGNRRKARAAEILRDAVLEHPGNILRLLADAEDLEPLGITEAA